MTAGTAELDRRRREIACLELLDASHRARDEGDRDRARVLDGQARRADPGTHAAVLAGTATGRIPGPWRDPAGWDGYLDSRRDLLAAAEAESEAVW